MYFRGYFRGKIFELRIPTTLPLPAQRRRHYIELHFLPSGFHWDYKNYCEDFSGIPEYHWRDSDGFPKRISSDSK